MDRPEGVSPRVLLLEGVNPKAEEIFTDAGYEVEALDGSLTQDELAETTTDVSVLGIRSATEVTPELLDAAPNLRAIGAFCIGVNKVDLLAATKNGIGVFNSPFGNSRSVAEFTINGIMSLLRRVPERNAEMHHGIWRKTANGSFEVRDKTLGIIGYGNIGTQVSTLAEQIGMHVLFYDKAEKQKLGNAVVCASMDELLEKSDVVTMHVDGHASNQHLISREQFAAMKDGALFVNNSRGMVVDTDALVEALDSGKLAGAAIDVFEKEPVKGQPCDSPLQGFDNVLLSPHIAGSTQEAQLEIARFASHKLISYIAKGDSSNSVNLPELTLAEPRLPGHRLLYIHQNVPGALAKVNAILTAKGANVTSQSLETRGSTGYVSIDTDKAFTPEDLQSIRLLDENIRVRVV